MERDDRVFLLCRRCVELLDLDLAEDGRVVHLNETLELVYVITSLIAEHWKALFHRLGLFLEL